MYKKNTSLLEKAMGISINDVLNHYAIPIYEGKIRCLWHDDSNPSGHINQELNKGYCFSCSKGAFSSIDIVMLKEELDFTGAMLFLINNFTINKSYTAKNKKNSKLYFMISDEIKNIIKNGVDIKLVSKYASMIHLNNDNEKIMLKLYGALLKRINGAMNDSQRDANREKI